ncbi:MAG: hypothetical protein Q4E02_03390 [Lagierella massiliensis]|nr:hypothetical protein [Lagierella massiliensis]
MKKFFEELKISNPNLCYKIKNSTKEQEELINRAIEENCSNKTPEELKEHLKFLKKIYNSIKIDDLQLRLDSFENAKIPIKKVTLDHDFTYTKPEGYRLYRGKLIEVNSYQKLYINLCNYFYKLNPKIFRSFPQKTEFNGLRRQYFSFQKYKIKNPTLIQNQIYIETKFTSNKIRDLLIKIFKAYNISFKNLDIFIKQDRKELYGYYERK